MLYIFDESTDPYWNLAAEEYLLKNLDESIFRLWRNDKSIIVGNYQNTLAEIDIKYVKDNNIKVVRRLSGGGAVFHDLGNINFTFIEAKKNGEDSSAMFKRFTAPIIQAINSLGTTAYLQGRNDLLIDDKKISGNAVCIYKSRVLQHGTLLFSSSMGDLSAALKNRPEKFVGKSVQSNRNRVTNIQEHLNCKMTVEDFKEYIGNYICSCCNNNDAKVYNYTKEDLKAINSLKETKYSQDSWNFGKSPDYAFKNIEKLSGGVVELYFNVEKGLITNLQIYGDYFFTKDTEDFIKQIIGTPHLPNKISEVLNKIDESQKSNNNPLGLQSYFNNVSNDELLNLFFK